MNFAPYHAFANCGRLERTVEQVRETGGVSDTCYQAFQRYHYSLIHKLRSAKYHVDTLQGYLASDTARDMKPTDLVYRVNFHFDGFLHVIGSASDIFAREMLSYFGVALPARVYFGTAESQLTAHRPGDPVLPLLVAAPWRLELGNYRNTATHESIIGTQYSLQVEIHGHTSTSRTVFPVPDDPRAAARTYRKHADIVVYCQTSFRRVVSQFNQAYGHVASRVAANGILPI